MASNATIFDVEKVGKLIREKRANLEMTQFKLAECTGIGQKSISHLEAGRDMKISTFFALVEAFGCTPNDLSPGYTSAEKSDPAFAKIQEKYTKLSTEQKKMASAMMSSILDSIIQYG